jgi:hypothetical protein
MRRRLATYLTFVALSTGGCVSGGGSPTPVAPAPSGGGQPLASLLRGATPQPSFAPSFGQPASSSPVVIQLPAVTRQDAGVGPPAWVKPGTRLTFYGRAASIAQSYYTYVEDPEGDWEDPTTGKHYRRSDQGGDAQDMPTAAGEAYTQTDVLAVEGNDVVISTTMYSIDLLARKLTLNPLGGSRVPGAVVDGAWINPDLLHQVVTTGYQGLLILRGPYLLGGTTYDAVSFIASDAGYQSSTYDAATGKLLATNTSTQGAGSPVHGPLDNPQGNVEMSLTRFVSVRQLNSPAVTAPAPAWVASTPSLSYTGTFTQVNPVDPGAGSWVYPMQMTVALGDGGATWRSFTSHTSLDLNGSPQTTDAAGVTGGTGLYWYDPATLATLSPGDVIDEDPTTGARTSVVGVEPAGSGATVTLATDMSGVSARLGYDRDSGTLLTMEVAQAVTGATIRLQLASGG